MNVSRTQIFKLGIWICMLAIGIPVSYRTEGEWFSSTESMDLLSFIDEMCIQPDVEISLRSHRKEIKAAYVRRIRNIMMDAFVSEGERQRGGKPIQFKRPPAYSTDNSNG